MNGILVAISKTHFFFLDRHPHTHHNVPMRAPQARFRLKTKEEDPAWQCQTSTKTRKEQVGVAEWHVMCSIPLINTHTIAVMGACVNLQSFSGSEPSNSCRVHPLLSPHKRVELAPNTTRDWPRTLRGAGCRLEHSCASAQTG
jgi:hypothetical protein